MPSILDYAEPLCAVLNTSQDTIAKYIADGSLQIFPGKPPPGFVVIHTDDSLQISASAFIRHRHLIYAHELQIIENEISSGRTNLLHILRCLRKEQRTPKNDEKVRASGLKVIYGHEVILRPFMGKLIPMRRDMGVDFHHFAFQHVLLSRLSTEMDVVFEIGMGLGDSLAELAMSNPFPNIDFIGGEIALNGLRSLEHFARAASLKNLKGIEFDILNPDFSFLRGKRNALVFSHGALVYANPFQDSFFRKLFETVENVQVVLLEQISHSLAKQLNIQPLFDQKRAQKYGFGENLWDCIQTLRNEGVAQIEDVIPDFAGKSIYSSASLVRFRKIRSQN